MINKETINLNNTIHQQNLKGVSRPIHQTAAEYTLFSSVRETFSRTDDMEGHKTNFNKSKRTQMIRSSIDSMFFPGDKIKLEIHYRKTLENLQIMKIKQNPLNNQ